MPYYAYYFNREIYMLLSEEELQSITRQDPEHAINREGFKKFRQLNDAKKYLRSEFMADIRKTRNALNEVSKYKARD